MTDESTDETLTLTAENKQALFDSLVEITHQLAKADEVKSKIKEIATDAQNDYGVKTKYINKMAKVMYAKTFKDVQDEAAHFEGLYEFVVGEQGAEYAKD